METPRLSRPAQFDLSTPEGREAFYRYRDSDPATFWGLKQTLRKVAAEQQKTQTQHSA